MPFLSNEPDRIWRHQGDKVTRYCRWCVSERKFRVITWRGLLEKSHKTLHLFAEDDIRLAGREKRCLKRDSKPCSHILTTEYGMHDIECFDWCCIEVISRRENTARFSTSQASNRHFKVTFVQHVSVIFPERLCSKHTEVCSIFWHNLGDII